MILLIEEHKAAASLRISWAALRFRAAPVTTQPPARNTEAQNNAVPT